MKAVSMRIERLYESEVERWRAAWERFMDDLMRPLNREEVRAYLDFEKVAHDEAVCARLAPIIEAWNREAECVDDGGAAFRAFLDAFWEAMPPDHDHPDLSRWPEGVPPAPPDDDGTEVRIWKLCRRDKGKGEDERLAAGFVLMQLAMARVARIYHRPPD